jgi:GntR family transcriptional regulator
MQAADSRPDMPRYRALAETLRRRIAGGVHAPGSQLPTESDLAQAFAVSRGTVIKAIDLLVAEGIVTKRQGAGSFVALPSLHRRSSRLLSFSETVNAQGHKASQRVLSYRPAGDDEARAFGVVEPAALLVRLRYVDRIPCAIHRSVIPDRVMGALPVEMLGQIVRNGESDFSLYAAFEAAGLVIGRGNEHVSARLATRDEAAALNVRLPAALMVVVRHSHGADGRLIEAAEAIYHADHYSYDLELVRGAAHDIPHRLHVTADTSGQKTQRER